RDEAHAALEPVPAGVALGGVVEAAVAEVADLKQAGEGDPVLARPRLGQPERGQDAAVQVAEDEIGRGGHGRTPRVCHRTQGGGGRREGSGRTFSPLPGGGSGLKAFALKPALKAVFISYRPFSYRGGGAKGVWGKAQARSGQQADLQPEPPRLDSQAAVHVQSGHGGPARGGGALQGNAVAVPPKMPLPGADAGVEQPDRSPRHRVRACDPV